MGGISNQMRLLRRLLGLPYESGYWTAHPSHEPPEGLRHRENGSVWFDPALKCSRVVVEGSQECKDLEMGDEDSESKGEDGRAKGVWWQRAHRILSDPDDEYVTQASIPRKRLDAGLQEMSERAWMSLNAVEGDEAQVSVSLAEDVWHVLTQDVSIGRLLVLEVVLEFVLIFTFALILFLFATVENSAPAGESAGSVFVSKLLLSLTSVPTTFIPAFCSTASSSTRFACSEIRTASQCTSRKTPSSPSTATTLRGPTSSNPPGGGRSPCPNRHEPRTTTMTTK